MCLAVPGQVLSIDGRLARVVFGGVERQVCLDLIPTVAPGDYVLVHAGFAIQRMDSDEAAEMLSLVEEVFAVTLEDKPEGEW